MGGSSAAKRWAALQVLYGRRGFRAGLAAGGQVEVLQPAATLFPDGPIGLHAEIMLANGAWIDVTGKLLHNDRVSVTRGRSDQAAQVDRSTASMALLNPGGLFSPRMPTSPYYGLIGQNTPIRLWVPASVALDSPGESGVVISGGPEMQVGAWAADAPALDITGDIDIRVDATLGDWCGRNLCSKYVRGGNQRSWALQTDVFGVLALRWSPDGTLASLVNTEATLPMPLFPGRRAVRCTLDVDNGAGGWTVTFYTADTIAGPWIQVGDAVSGAGVTSIFNGSAPVWVGSADLAGGVDPTQLIRGVQGRLNVFELRAGIGGTLVANPGFTAQAPGIGYFGDTIAAASNLWTLAGGAVISDRLYRFHGEVSEWPPKSVRSGKHVWVPIEASGILRRLGQGDSPLQSAMRRGVIRLTNGPPVAYWPCEDESGSTSLASGLDRGTPMTFTGAPSLGAYTGFVSSKPLPTLSGSTWTGSVTGPDTGKVQVRFLLAIPAGGLSNGAVICRLSLTGTLARVDLTYTTASSGGLTLTGYDSDGVLVFTSGTLTGFDGTIRRQSIQIQPDDVTPNLADLNCGFSSVEIGASFFSGNSTPATNRTAGRITKVVIAPIGGITDGSIGHISVHTTVTSVVDLADEANAYIGEMPGRRIERLCAEEGIAFRAIGSLGRKPSLIERVGEGGMGPQLSDTLVNLLQECAAVDGGMLYEPREELGLGYRALASMYNQPGLALDYGLLAEPPEPVDDDQQTRNDITIGRSGGSSTRAELTAGRRSTLPPPAGVGRYDESLTLNAGTDEHLPDLAAWRLHLGTVDEERYPQITVARHGRQLAADQALSRAVLDAEVGDLLVITGMPPHLPPDEPQQIIQGYTEKYGSFEHTIAFNNSPGSPYQVAVEGIARYDTAGSELAIGVDATATSMTVRTTLGPVWIDSVTFPAHFPFDVRMAGEVLRVTAITGTTSPQTFTVTRGVNGVTKAQLASAAVSLANPAIYAL